MYVDGIGLFGPGMFGWAQAREVLLGRSQLILAQVELPPVTALPAAERRRAGLPIRLALATGFAAVEQAHIDPTSLVSVFCSTGGDCDNCHQLLETLASDDRGISPTRFHNSVHNTPAGYWSIATGSMAPSTSLCAYDATFAVGLLEAASQAVASGHACLLVAYDTAYPQPLYALRPIPYAMAVGLVLSPVKTSASGALLTLALTTAAPTRMDDAPLDALSQLIPVARGLPLMQCLAGQRAASVVIEYLDSVCLAIEVQW